jgi:hypothetical protein
MLTNIIKIKQGKRKLCKHTNCPKVPSFNYRHKLTGEYCGDHKLDDMVNVTTRLCESCDTVACFNFADKTHPINCENHAKLGMINITTKK